MTILPSILENANKIKFKVFTGPKLDKRLKLNKPIAQAQQIANINFTKLFEIGGLNQTENRFDRLLSECANATVILGGPLKTAIIQIHGMKEVGQRQVPHYAKQQHQM